LSKYERHKLSVYLANNKYEMKVDKMCETYKADCFDSLKKCLIS